VLREMYRRTCLGQEDMTEPPPADEGGSAL